MAPFQTVQSVNRPQSRSDKSHSASYLNGNSTLAFCFHNLIQGSPRSPTPLLEIWLYASFYAFDTLIDYIIRFKTWVYYKPNEFAQRTLSMPNASSS